MIWLFLPLLTVSGVANFPYVLRDKDSALVVGQRQSVDQVLRFSKTPDVRVANSRSGNFHHYPPFSCEMVKVGGGSEFGAQRIALQWLTEKRPPYAKIAVVKVSSR